MSDSLRERRSRSEFDNVEDIPKQAPVVKWFWLACTTAVAVGGTVAGIAYSVYIKPQENNLSTLRDERQVLMEKNKDLRESLDKSKERYDLLKKSAAEKETELSTLTNKLKAQEDVPLPADFFKDGRVTPLFNYEVLLTVKFNYDTGVASFYFNMPDNQNDVVVKDVAIGKQGKFKYKGKSYNISVLQFSTNNYTENIPVVKFSITKA